MATWQDIITAAQTLLQRWKRDVDFTSQIVNGPATGPTSVVNTDGGTIPTFAKTLNDFVISNPATPIPTPNKIPISLVTGKLDTGWIDTDAVSAGLKSDLANNADALKGATLIGYNGSTVRSALDARVTSTDLANTSDPLKGAALVGTAHGTLANWLKYVPVPSTAPGNAYSELVAPLNGTTFIDNVLTIGNKSTDGTNYGNAALRFVDGAMTERGAVGYSRNNAIQPGGYYPNLLYCEIGNPFTLDTQNTNFGIPVTFPVGHPSWPAGLSYLAMSVDSTNGKIEFRSPTGVESIIAHGQFEVGGIGELRNFKVGLQNTWMRIKERRAANQVAITTNLGDDNAGTSVQDNGAYSSWAVTMGGGNDKLTIGRTPPFNNATAAMVDFVTIDNTGRVNVNQTVASAGSDGQVAVVGTGATSAVTAKHANTAIPTAIFYNADTTGDNQLVAFGTETSYTGRGGITYNRGAGLIAYNTTSDGTLKNKFGPAPVDVSKSVIMDSPISEYAWKDDPSQKRQIGPIAQELYDSGFKGAVHVGGIRDVMEDVFEDVFGDVEEDVFEEVVPVKYLTKFEYTAGPDGTLGNWPVRVAVPDEDNKQQVKVGTRIVNKKVGERKVGERKVGEQYDPWGVDKTAYTFHLVVLAQDQERRITELTALAQAQAEEIAAIKARI